MPAYFSHFRFKSVTTADFKKFLYSWFTDKYGHEMEKKLDSIDWETWLYGRGMPPVTPKFDMTLATPAYDLANRWAQAASKSSDPKDLNFKQSDLKGWFAGQICTPLSLSLFNSHSLISLIPNLSDVRRLPRIPRRLIPPPLRRIRKTYGLTLHLLHLQERGNNLPILYHCNEGEMAEDVSCCGGVSRKCRTDEVC